MAKSTIVAGIELGSTKITTIISQIHTDPSNFDTSISISGVSSVESKGIKKGQIVDIEDAVESTILSVEAAERMAGYSLSSAYVAIGGANMSSQNSHGVVAVSDPDGEITEDDTQRVIEAASAVSLPSSRELIHVIPRGYIVDGESGVRDPIGMSGVRLEIETHLITTSVSTLKNMRKALNEVGVDVEEFVFTGLAASEAVLSSTEKELGCVLVDIGGGTTSISAYVDGALSYSGVLPIGAKNVTNDLAIGLRVSLESAEKIKNILSNEKNHKTKKGNVGSEDDQLDLSSIGIKEIKKVSKKTLIEGIIRPRLNEIFTMVRIQLEKENIRSNVPSGTIVTGGGADTIGIEDSAKRMLSLPVRIGKPKGVTGLIDDIINPAYATPVGLVKYGAKRYPQASGYSISKKFKLPAKGVFGKITETIKDLLP